MMTQIHALHKRDPNFPLSIIEKIEQFLGTYPHRLERTLQAKLTPPENEDVFQSPKDHEPLINEMKIEAALITNNSPYAEVRSVVDNHDDPSLPCSTIRAWVLGIFFSVCIAFVNCFFDIRQPDIAVSSNVPQLLAYPLGKLMARLLPDVGVTLWGVRHSLNPGPFNRKEHMLITIMASIAKGVPYTNYIIWIQYLPRYFNQPWAISFTYQILVALSTNFIGYGLAGLCRRFLVYPSFCVWPSSLVTIALNTAFHTKGNPAVPGPRGSIWRISRLRFFTVVFAGMFCYFWLPNYLFMALSFFSWMTFISPQNRHLSWITGGEKGLGLNPLPTLDWNRMSYIVDPLMVPFFTTLNLFLGAMVSFIFILVMYYTNTYNTAYLPINSNIPFDNTGKRYNVTAILDERAILDVDKYQAYSPPFLSAGKASIYMFFFSTYTSAVTYGLLYHHREIRMGFQDLINSYRPSKKGQVDKRRVLDVHNRLMANYKEVPEWWYMICLAIAIVLGCVGIGTFPTYTSIGVVFYGVALSLIFIVPIGIIYAMTGIEVTLNVLAEFIGGSWVEGNALAMCYFKTYGFVTCSQALHFTSDLKLAHYVKIPPRFTFWAQMVPTLVSTFVCVAVLQYQIGIPDVCTPDAPFRFTCPGINTFFTAAVMWGTVGPKRLWGVGGQYVETLVGFPLGVAVVLVFWYLGKKFPKSATLRNIHPVVLCNGGLGFSPWNLTYIWPAVPVAAASWLYVKTRHLALWSKYNFVLSAALSAGIAISAIVQFFGLAYNNVEVSWWGNNVHARGCEGDVACVRLPLPPEGYFGPAPGNFN